jgi:ribonuclease E
MTRKRIGTGLLEAFSTECEVCHGRGYEIHEMPVESQRHADGGARDRGRQRGGTRRGGGRGAGGGRGGDGSSGDSADGQPKTPTEPAGDRPSDAPLPVG